MASVTVMVAVLDQQQVILVVTGSLVVHCTSAVLHYLVLVPDTGTTSALVPGFRVFRVLVPFWCSSSATSTKSPFWGKAGY